jgi:hypothetical protein
VEALIVLNTTSLLDLLALLADNGKSLNNRIHLNARDEFLLSRVFSLGHQRNSSSGGYRRDTLISLPRGNQTVCRDSLLLDRQSVHASGTDVFVINLTSPTAGFIFSSRPDRFVWRSDR